MSDRTFDTEEERIAYADGLAEAARKLQKPPLTRSDIERMTPQEIIARKSEVNDVMRRGLDAEKGDDDDADES